MKNIFILVVEDDRSSVIPVAKNSSTEVLVNAAINSGIRELEPLAMQQQPVAEEVKPKRTYTKRRRVNITPIGKSKSLYKGAGGGKFRMAISKNGKTYKRYLKKK